ncbi:SH3 domain-containing protein 2-like isoform X2 [Vitis riparia]|uniref:SH3 domain-containing protein 2-like isoform X2 n=1 Tax=Vitis riparia TaxID=96939 RepID=UPI00155A6033|nr:SH3 domain-containing protein 2-like isoform X2 [Vitis riparia]
MEAIRKQASKLREQVARQQQAVLKQLGHFGIETVVVDEAEQRQLQNLYNSTRTAKHFQKDIVRGIEGFVSTSSKQMEIVRRMAEDCCKYGTENQSTGSPLARAALYFGNSHSSMEKERETLLGVLCDQVSEPLRVLITGAPLEDARHLTHRYERLRQEVESQAADVLRRQAKFKDPATSAESSIKLQSAEAKLSELKSAMMALGREATAAMLSVEAQQQRITFQRLLTMVEAERSYHQTVLATLEKLYDEVIHPFDAQADGELGLSVDDYVVVRQVAPNGWSEGECKGTAGWFPSAYVERRDKAPASVINEEASLAMIPN